MEGRPAPLLHHSKGKREPRTAKEDGDGAVRFLVGKRMLCGLLVATALAGTTAGAALAFFTGAGTGAGHAIVGTMKAPEGPQATAGAGTVALSWTAVPSPAWGSVSYYVSRDGTPVGGSCGDPSSPITGTSCTDSGLGAGSYGYTVTAVWQSWTTTSPATPVSLSSGAAAQIVLSGSTDPLASGSPRQLTATVEDAR